MCLQLWFEAKSQCNMEVSLEQQEVLLQKHNKICKLFNRVFFFFFFFFSMDFFCLFVFGNLLKNNNSTCFCIFFLFCVCVFFFPCLCLFLEFFVLLCLLFWCF